MGSSSSYFFSADAWVSGVECWGWGWVYARHNVANFMILRLGGKNELRKNQLVMATDIYFNMSASICPLQYIVKVLAIHRELLVVHGYFADWIFKDDQTLQRRKKARQWIKRAKS
ncbi:hypothetical protein EJB05_46965 [Eragrostis curvula]|uniref:Uncharacterized protein n=1 Tax=Eragrostis curvula TaxID=38414 RepID=A0A5J9T673_9POAL|nr:hypothetical protein EJB05_46965 [Eragrostis curvula]